MPLANVLQVHVMMLAKPLKQQIEQPLVRNSMRNRVESQQVGLDPKHCGSTGAAVRLAGLVKVF